MYVVSHNAQCMLYGLSTILTAYPPAADLDVPLVRKADAVKPVT